MVRVLLLWLLLGPTAAAAGAWPRGEGNIFAAFGVEGGSDGVGATIYVEYGFSERLTFGLDAYLDADDESVTAVVFAQYALPLAGPNVWALGAGYGQEFRIDERLTQLPTGGPIFPTDHPRSGDFFRISGHFGRGLPKGWLAIDASFDFGELSSDVDPPLPDVDIERLKLDATYGRRFGDRSALIGQLFFYDDQNGSTLTASLGASYDFAIVTGLIALKQDLNESGTALKIGLSRSF